MKIVASSQKELAWWRKITSLVLLFTLSVGTTLTYVFECKLHKGDHGIPLYVAAIECILIIIDLVIDIKQTNRRNNKGQATNDEENEVGTTNEGKPPLLK